MFCPSIQVDLVSPDATTGFAQRLAPRLRAGDVLLLSGPVGAGKTHFARALISACLTQPEDIPSPTFTLVQTYDARPCEIWHADLYRLGSSYEIIELGLTEAFSTAICLVEWPERLGDLAPDDALALAFTAEQGEDQRALSISWQAGAWQDRIGDLLHG